MPDPAAASAPDAELHAHVERALSAAYEVDEEIGRGGMGIVYRAKDKRLKRYVAIKLLPPELSFRRDIRTRFLREAETAAQLSHPNIVPIYSVDEVENLVFFVMAYVDGDNLAKKLRDRGPLPIEDVRRCLTEVADAMAYAHSRGVIHRDIKPDNILLDKVDGRAMVTDFGIARAGMDSGDHSRLTATGIAIGTPAYMSPEQASGDRDVDGRSDLYSLGIVAYQMLVGEPPFIGNTTPALLVKHLAELPRPLDQRRSDVPPDLSQIVMRLLEKSPDHRFQTAGELTQALRTGVVPTPIPGARNVPSLTPPNQWSPPSPDPTDSRQLLVGVSVGSKGLKAAARTAREAAGAQSARTPDDTDSYIPTSDDIDRWEAPPVQSFRKKLRLFIPINVVVVMLAVFAGRDTLSITTIWSIYLAYKYAKLWADGYDWRDVLRQPRHRMFGEVISDLVDGTSATFSRRKREELRSQGRLGSKLKGSLSPVPVTYAGAHAGAPRSPRPANAAPSISPEMLAEFAPIVQRAREDRDEINRLLATLPPAERARIPDVAATSKSLVEKIEAIAFGLASSAREVGLRPVTEIDAEIAQLESEANPFDTARSETRVRRLAQLRRERRVQVDQSRKREEGRARLESCRLALENVKIDLVRLRTGNSSVQSVTLVAEQAMALAREVDLAVNAANEVRDLTRARSTKSPA